MHATASLPALQASLSSDVKWLAGPIWISSLGALALAGCAMLRAYLPRLNKPFVGHIE